LTGYLVNIADARAAGQKNPPRHGRLPPTHATPSERGFFALYAAAGIFSGSRIGQLAG